MHMNLHAYKYVYTSIHMPTRGGGHLSKHLGTCGGSKYFYPYCGAGALKMFTCFTELLASHPPPHH